MGLFDVFRKKGKARPEEELRVFIVDVKGVLKETQEIVVAMPPGIREGATRSFIENVGESVEDLLQRLEKMERKLLTVELNDIPRQELSGLKGRMSHLDDHLIHSYLETRKLPGNRRSRKAIKGAIRRRTKKVEALLKALERLTR
ncbi:MAG: hypothetical protein NT131_06730 [Methanomassiliicoccales archaeon]|nr:hypothetical protein [Methanomassiliicoccales archaeon]